MRIKPGARMALKESLLVLTVLCVGEFVCSCTNTAHLVDAKEINKDGIQIRILRYEESQPLIGLPGSFYVYESRDEGQGWKKFMEFRHDDQIPIPIDQVKVFAQGKAAVFIGWRLAVTLDGGLHWTVWDAAKAFPEWKCCNYKLINEVSIHSDGWGEMRLNPITGSGESRMLTTRDFGVHWNKE